MEESTQTTTSTAAPASEPAPAARPDTFTASGDVNPEWVKSVTTPPAREHETDREPSSGRTTRSIYPNADPQQQNGDVPRPELLGQYARENVLSYARGAQGQQDAYDFSNAMSSLMADPRPENYAQFIQNVPAEHLPGLQDLARNFIAHDPENVIRELIAMNHLPSWILPPPQGVVDPDDPMLEFLSPEMRAYVRDNVDLKTWEEYLHFSADARHRALQRDMELHTMKQQEYRQRAETAVKEWNQQMDTIEDDARMAVFEAVQALQPFEDSRANEKAQDYCILASWAQVLNDPHLQNIREVAGEGFRLAAEERWRGNEKMAKGREMNARRLLAELNKEFKEKLDANIKQFQLFFEHAPGARQPTPAQTDQPQTYIN